MIFELHTRKVNLLTLLVIYALYFWLINMPESRLMILKKEGEILSRKKIEGKGWQCELKTDFKKILYKINLALMIFFQKIVKVLLYPGRRTSFDYFLNL